MAWWDNYQINKHSELWNHTNMRIDNALVKANGDTEKFEKAMIQRLKAMRHKNKLIYALEALRDRGYEDLADMYDGRLVMDEMTKNL